MAFDAGKFLKTPDLEGFDNLKKEELVLLAKHLKLNFKVSMRKQIIKNLVIDKLVEAEILGEEALELKVENVDAFKLKQLELEHELKLKELEMKEIGKKGAGKVLLKPAPEGTGIIASRIVAMSFCEPRSCYQVLSS